jgi:hypothetical protein
MGSILKKQTIYGDFMYLKRYKSRTGNILEKFVENKLQATVFNLEKAQMMNRRYRNELIIEDV